MLATMRGRDGEVMLTRQYEVNGSPSGLLHMLTAVLTFAPGEPYDRARLMADSQRRVL